MVSVLMSSRTATVGKGFVRDHKANSPMLYSLVLIALTVPTVAVRDDIKTDIIVEEADWGKYNVGGVDTDTPCQSPQVYELVMCSSGQCSTCSEKWCVATCQEWQKKMSLCRCPNWPEGKNSYS